MNKAASGALGGAASGAATGFGVSGTPWGALAGGLIGGAVGGFQGNAADKLERMQNMSRINALELSGYTNKSLGSGTEYSNPWDPAVQGLAAGGSIWQGIERQKAQQKLLEAQTKAWQAMAAQKGSSVPALQQLDTPMSVPGIRQDSVQTYPIA